MATASIQDTESSGISVSISGVSGTARLMVAKYLGDVSSNAFESKLSTAVAVTNQVIALDPGAYVAVVMDDDGPSTPQGFRVTDGSLGIHQRCLEAIREHVIALSLPSFPSDVDMHKLHKQPKNSFKEFTEWAGSGPKSQANIHGVHYWKRAERPRQSYNTRQTVEYKVEMVLIRSRGGSNKADADWTYDRERIITSFAACPLPSVEEVHGINFLPGRIYGDNGGSPNVESQSMQFVCLADMTSVAF